MADLEEYALKRDRRFLVRLVLALLVGVAVASILFAKLTSQSTTSCLAEQFSEAAPAPTSPADSSP